MRRSGLLTASAIAIVTCWSTLVACESEPASPTRDVLTSAEAAAATSVGQFGGMEGLIRAAKAEGSLNVVALSPDRAGYGQQLEAFSTKYGIRINSASPEATSQHALDAVVSQRGQDRAPDVLDLGASHAHQAAAQDLLAVYRMEAWGQIPDGQKDPEGRWHNAHGGYVSFGCNDKIIDECPEGMADLLAPTFLGQVALGGDPTQVESAFGAVWAAALANGGTLDNIGPGIDFFTQLKATGKFSPVPATPATIQSGQTPVVIDWDYQNVGLTDALADQGVVWEVDVPRDGLFGNYFSQAISKTAPHPAAARLWMEFLYSFDGQNTILRGGVRPVLLPSMQAAGTADAMAAAVLPEVEGTAIFPTEAQRIAAQQVVAQRWYAEMSG